LLEKNATRVRDARDPLDPRANEIDLRWVPHAGVAGSFFDPTMKMRIGTMFQSMRKGLFYMARDGKVQTAHDALAAVLSASMMNAADQLDLRNIFDIMSLIIEMQAEISADVEVNHPTLAQRKEFGDFRKHVEILKGLLGERRYTFDALQNLSAYQQKAGEIVTSIFGGGPAVVVDDTPSAAPKPAAAAAPTAGGMTVEAVKGISQLELPTELVIDGKTWVQVDKIDVMDKDSEEKH